MTHPTETVRDYLVNVAKRTLGINEYKVNSIQAPSGPLGSGAIQLFLPFSSRVSMSEDERTLLPAMLDATKFTTALAVDLATYPIIYSLVGMNLAELAVFKLAANAATHVALDVLGATARRVRNFRPSATTLAV